MKSEKQLKPSQLVKPSTSIVSHFNHAGKSRRLFRRTPSGPWYIKIIVAGNRVVRSTGSPLIKIAQERARKIIDAATAGHWQALDDSKLKRPPSAPVGSTVAQVISAYLAAPLETDPKTRRRNVLCWLNVLRTATGKADADLQRAPVTVWQPAIIDQWFEVNAERADLAGSQADGQRVKRSANSILNQARGVFTAPALRAYRRAGLVVPDLGACDQRWKEEKFRKVTKREYDPPAPEIIEATLAAWRAAEDRNLICAIGLAYCAGLRKQEIAQARWDWIRTQATGPAFIVGQATVKSGSGEIRVPMIPDHWEAFKSILDERAYWSAPEDFILSGTPTERRETVFRRVSRFMSDLGWRTQKAAHEWRALAGSVVARRHGIYHASGWLRHSSVAITEQFYVRYLKMFEVAGG